jgi:AbrB family looped-hinge helix DNA binding protein
MTEISTLSSKGQIVIPKALREEMQLSEGDPFIVYGKKDTILIKKLNVPSEKETFKEINKWGKEFVKEKNIKEKDVVNIIHKRRKLKK